MIKEPLSFKDSDSSSDMYATHSQVPLGPWTFTGERKRNSKEIGFVGEGRDRRLCGQLCPHVCKTTFYLPGQELLIWSDLKKT